VRNAFVASPKQDDKFLALIRREQCLAPKMPALTKGLLGETHGFLANTDASSHRNITADSMARITKLEV
jgi:hypothetical protein